MSKCFKYWHHLIELVSKPRDVNLHHKNSTEKIVLNLKNVRLFQSIWHLYALKMRTQKMRLNSNYSFIVG